VKYRVQFQYRAKGKNRPEDHGQSFDLTGSPSELLLVPNIGDHVSMPHWEEIPTGVVDSRYFSFRDVSGDMICLINVVITESNAPPGRLMKG
jgi:hypothetical protein